ncbi:class I SAM-dependent methyltransferase [Wukongibacter sp. M2B1]|uniref:class I SAM-dependent methyltransferase n=1 Tax=Wukongibacter sp. M2B1 TaxID=3088895 RepID=UPI003D797312
MNITNFEEIWSSPSQQDLLETQKFWDIRAEEYNKNHQKDKLNLIDLLVSKGAINKGYDVLDVGCGTGKYMIEFAKVANSVTGIDISHNMISHAKKNVESMKLNNVSFNVVPWQELDVNEFNWNKKFDLVFSNMSPAIIGKEALIKMIETSKKYCFMSGFVYREDKIRDELFKRIMGEKYRKKTQKSIYCAFNILWNMGIYPEITYKDVVWTNKMSNETAIDIYTIMLEKMAEEDYCIKEKIKAYIDEMSCDGKIEEVIKAKIAWMLWKVT